METEPLDSLSLILQIQFQKQLKQFQIKRESSDSEIQSGIGIVFQRRPTPPLLYQTVVSAGSCWSVCVLCVFSSPPPVHTAYTETQLKKRRKKVREMWEIKRTRKVQTVIRNSSPKAKLMEVTSVMLHWTCRAKDRGGRRRREIRAPISLHILRLKLLKCRTSEEDIFDIQDV
ncbi:hypothetical protein AOLI_G00198570 [Acnodon oligacanthus]